MKVGFGSDQQGFYGRNRATESGGDFLVGETFIAAEDQGEALFAGERADGGPNQGVPFGSEGLVFWRKDRRNWFWNLCIVVIVGRPDGPN